MDRVQKEVVTLSGKKCGVFTCKMMRHFSVENRIIDFCVQVYLYCNIEIALKP